MHKKDDSKWKDWAPIGEQILAISKPLNQTEAGIVLPGNLSMGSAEEQLLECLVVSLGDKVAKDISIREGDRVIIPSYAGYTMDKGDTLLHIIKEGDILLKIV